jgi:hypothetical protein
MVPNVSEPHLDLDHNSEIRILAMVPVAGEVSQLALGETSYQVALLPADVPGNGWWSLWGEIALLSPRPEILVYTHKPSFELWSGVLEAGGFDILVEPLTAGYLQRAVLRAAKSFSEKL